MSKWIKVTDSLPPIRRVVLVCLRGDIALAEIFLIGADGTPMWSYTGLGGAPTHWMPLPEAPKEDK